jgi:hypothetical protein
MVQDEELHKHMKNGTSRRRVVVQDEEWYNTKKVI